jgi:POT family proton-dependent oligopeptide transporter
MRAPGGTFLGYPKGVFLLSFTELWERFSYFGMLALLVLFLSSSVAEYGFGWERSEALKLYGLYTGLVFSGPLLGGFIANHWWGERRCIAAGGLLVILGQFLLTGPALLPWAALQLTGVDHHAMWRASGIALALLIPDGAALAALENTATAAGVAPAQAEWLYRLTGLSFLAGLACIVGGTAFIKPTISSIIGRFFDEGDARRDGAFSIFFVGIYAGAISASLIAGYLGERAGWHWGFSAAGFGMTLGMIAYLYRQQEYLADLGVQAVRAAGGGARRRLSTVERQRIAVIFVQGLFTVVYAAAFFQKGGLLTLFANEQVDRTLGDMLIPTTWFLMVSTGTFILVTPLAARLWQALALRGCNPSASVKLAWGLLALGLGYVAISVGTAAGGADQKTWFGWLVLTYICFGIGDTLVWPTQISLVTKLAPAELSALFVGGWYITIGIGSWLTGYIGALAFVWDVRSVFLLLATICLALGALLWLCTPRLLPWMHGAEGQGATPS